MHKDIRSHEMGIDFFRGLTGDGTVLMDNRELPTSFALDIPDDYSVSIVNQLRADSEAVLQHALSGLKSLTRDRVVISGTTTNGYSFYCEMADRERQVYAVNDGPPTITLTAVPRKRVTLKKRNLYQDGKGFVRFGVTNMEEENYRPLSFHLGKYTVSAKAVSQHDKLVSRLKEGEIPRAVTYELMTEVGPISQMADLEDKIYVLTLMLSALKLNDIKPYYCIVQNESGEIVLANLYTDVREANFIGFFKMIDDKHISGATECCVNQCYKSFLGLHRDVNLHPFIFDLLFAARTAEVHIGIVVLILGLEYLVTHYGRRVLGWKADDGQTLISKLDRLNSHIRCIPKEHLDSRWTHRIRNPLVHTGTIVDASSKELVTVLYDLQRLLTLVFLRLLEYTGSYIDCSCPPRVIKMPPFRSTK